MKLIPPTTKPSRLAHSVHCVFADGCLRSTTYIQNRAHAMHSRWILDALTIINNFRWVLRALLLPINTWDFFFFWRFLVKCRLSVWTSASSLHRHNDPFGGRLTFSRILDDYYLWQWVNTEYADNADSGETTTNQRCASLPYAFPLAISLIKRIRSDRSPQQPNGAGEKNDVQTTIRRN